MKKARHTTQSHLPSRKDAIVYVRTTENTALTTSIENPNSSVSRETGAEVSTDVSSQDDRSSYIPSQASDPDLERIRKRYDALVDMDHKMQRHITTATTIPVVNASSNQLQNEEAWFRGTLQILESVDTCDDNATAVLVAAMLARAHIALQDIATRRTEIADIMPNPASPDVFKMGLSSPSP